MSLLVRLDLLLDFGIFPSLRIVFVGTTETHDAHMDCLLFGSGVWLQGQLRQEGDRQGSAGCLLTCV